MKYYGLSCEGESGSKSSLFVAKTLLSGRYPQRRGQYERQPDTYTRGGGGEDDIDIYGRGSEEDGFDTEDGFDQWRYYGGGRRGAYAPPNRPAGAMQC